MVYKSDRRTKDNPLMSLDHLMKTIDNSINKYKDNNINNIIREGINHI